MSTDDSMRKLLNEMNSGRAEQLGCERTLDIWEAFCTWLGDPRAGISSVEIAESYDSVLQFGDSQLERTER